MEPVAETGPVGAAWRGLRRWLTFGEPLGDGFGRLEAHPRWRLLGCLYVFAGLFWCWNSVGAMSYAEAGGVGVLFAFLVSVDVVWPVLKSWFCKHLVILLACWAAWLGLSLLWSIDPAKGRWELASLRFAYSLPALWPLMGHRRKLVYALTGGFIFGNLTQLVLWCGHRYGVQWMEYKAWHPRNPGWWTHPAEAGYMLVGALGLHLPVALMGKGRARCFAIAGCVASVAGMLATGTRGAWLGATALVGVVGAVAVVSGSWKWKSVLWAAACAAVLSGAAWVGYGEVISTRAHQGIAEIRGALEHQEYETDTGARIKFVKWGWEMFREKPVLGWGAGSYGAWVDRTLRSQGVDPAKVRTEGSADNAWVHIGATLGLVGLLIAGSLTLAALRGGISWARGSLGTYDAGPLFALVGMVLVTPFDVAYVNSAPAAFVAVLLALCIRRPAAAQESAGPTVG